MAAETSGQLYESKVIAQLFGVSVRRIQQLTQDGVLETVHISGQRNKYDLIPRFRHISNTCQIRRMAGKRSSRKPN